MVTIIAVADHARRAYTSDDGIVIHDLVAPVLRRGESVVVSFKDVDAATTSFVNGAFIELLESFDLGSQSCSLAHFVDGRADGGDQGGADESFFQSGHGDDFRDRGSCASDDGCSGESGGGGNGERES